MRIFLHKFLFFILAGIVLLLGLITTAVSFQKSNPTGIREYLTLNNETAVHLKAGRYTIFYEYNESKTQLGPVKITRHSKISNPPDYFSVSIKGNDGLIAVEKDPSMKYSINQSRGESIASFSVEREQEYLITVEAPSRSELDSAKLTLLNDFTKQISAMFKNIGLYILIFIPLFIAGIISYSRSVNRTKLRPFKVD